MELAILKNEEKRMNMIMFLVDLVIPVVAFFYVFLFNGGSIKDIIVLLMSFCGIMIKLFEKRLDKYAKYLYLATIPALGVVTIVVGNDGVFGAFPEAYIWCLMLAVPYYDLSAIKTTALATVIPNAVGLILFPGAYLKMRTFSIWIFILMVYTLAILVSVLIVLRARELFATVEEKENEAEKLVNNVQETFNGLQEASEKIFASLQEFEANTEEITASAEEIAGGADVQIKEVESSLDIFSKLNEKIANSNERINQTVDIMKGLKDKNDEGIVAIEVLGKKFAENIETTKAAATGVEDLSQKSSSIGGIVESIRSIAQQTNLLALNAAIEAARAGEAGKGFAVVADEINSLSAESSEATGKIDDILQDVIEKVNDTEKVIARNSKAVTESNEKLEDTVEIFKTMLASSNEVISVADLLRRELEDIVEIKEQLLQAMEKVNDTSRKSASDSNEISMSIEGQATEVENILNNMEKVKRGMECLAEILDRRDNAVQE